jgi:hypothetical protein
MTLRRFSIQRLASHQGFVKFVAISEFKQCNFYSVANISFWFNHRLAEFEENLDDRAHAEELAALRMEENTWGLLQALIPCVGCIFVSAIF